MFVNVGDDKVILTEKKDQNWNHKAVNFLFCLGRMTATAEEASSFDSTSDVWAM